MNCSRHPEKRVISACKDCGSGFCIDCVRETDQTTYCFDCYRRRLVEVTREVSEAAEKKVEAAKAPTPKVKAPPRGKPVSGTPGAEAPPRKKPRRAVPTIKGRLGRHVGLAKEKGALEETAEAKQGEFLTLGPDEDFSALTKERAGVRKRPPRRRAAPAVAPPLPETAVVPEPPQIAETPPQIAETPPQPQEVPPPETASAVEVVSEDTLLQDVVSTLLGPDIEVEVEEVEAPAVVNLPVEEAAVEPVSKAVAEPVLKAVVEESAVATVEEAPVCGEGRAARWSFLAQPRVVEYTTLSTAWWRTTLFIVLVLLGGALLWALPNAYLIPRDQEYGIHALVIGIIIGLLFWWKAGKKHGTKLAVQACLTTFFALILGEFLHWFLIIVKNQAFRTIFFDLISFRFLWENGPTIMRNTIEAMFPVAFIWVLLLPTAAAFFIAFGMPPIPEIFFQIGRAIKGQTTE